MSTNYAKSRFCLAHWAVHWADLARALVLASEDSGRREGRGQYGCRGGADGRRDYCGSPGGGSAEHGCKRCWPFSLIGRAGREDRAQMLWGESLRMLVRGALHVRFRFR